LPPPPDLIKKSVVENEEFKTGAPIPFVKFDRLIGIEKQEALSTAGKNGQPEDQTVTEIAPAQTINDYMLNAKVAGRLVYCRYGEKYILDIERRKNSNISALNMPTLNYASASYLINIKKLIEDYNIESDKREFRSMKTSGAGAGKMGAG